MLIPLIRTFILYFTIVISMRFMGKRQVGEMQPAELVITILISAVASVPMQDVELPLLHGIVPIIVLVAAEVILSSLSLKFPVLRKLISGRPITIIRNGVIDQQSLKKLRVNIDDLLEDLRLKDVYDLRTVRLAQIETNGQISVLIDGKYAPPSSKDMNIKCTSTEPFETVISDGKIIKGSLNKINKNERWLLSIIKSNGVKCVSEVFFLACNSKDEIIFSKRNDKI